MFGLFISCLILYSRVDVCFRNSLRRYYKQHESALVFKKSLADENVTSSLATAIAVAAAIAAAIAEETAAAFAVAPEVTATVAAAIAATITSAITANLASIFFFSFLVKYL